MKTTATLITLVAAFAIGYAAGKAKKQVRTTPVDKQEEPEAI